MHRLLDEILPLCVAKTTRFVRRRRLAVIVECLQLFGLLLIIELWTLDFLKLLRVCVGGKSTESVHLMTVDNAGVQSVLELFRVILDCRFFFNFAL